MLADWGADVIKIEHPETGDPQRGLSIGTVGAKGAGGVSFAIEQPNRSKRSLGLNIATEEGREILLRLVAKADVFLTNLLPDRLGRLRLTVEDLRAVNPQIIVARGTGQGVRGEDANRAGFDGSSYFSRGGVAHMLMEQNMEWPPMQRPAFGDILGGFALASGIAAALFKRERTGEPSVVDVSLLGMAAWHLSPDLVAHRAARRGQPAPLHRRRHAEPDRQLLQDRRRPVHPADDAAGRPVLARGMRAHRAARPDHRRAVRHQQGPVRQPRRVHRRPARGVRRPHA